MPSAHAHAGASHQNTIAVRFGDPMLEEGHTAIPNLVLRYYAQAGITTEEMMFTIQVWVFWWTEKDPYPSLEKIATRMGVSLKSARRYSISLQQKALLKVTPRVERGGQITNQYNFSRLLRVIRLLKEKDDQKDETRGKTSHHASSLKKPAAKPSSPTALPKLGGGRPPKTGRGRRRIPKEDLILDQIDDEKLGETEKAAREDPRDLSATRDRSQNQPPPPTTSKPFVDLTAPAEPTPIPAPTPQEARPKRGGGFKSLAHLIERGEVAPASQFTTRPSKGSLRPAKAPGNVGAGESHQSAEPPSAIPPSALQDLRVTARIADYVCDIAHQHGDQRDRANIAQMGGLYAKSQLSEHGFIDWLIVTEKEIERWHRSHPRSPIKNYMAVFYTALKRNLQLTEATSPS